MQAQLIGAFSILELAVLIGLAILVHELGHFLAARLCGIRVLQFSIGFGPRLFGFKKGHTDYSLCAIPLGGFVRLAGEEWGEGRHLKRYDLMAKPAWMRMIVYVAGVAMNVALAFILFTGRSMRGEDIPNFPAVLGSVESGTQAAEAGLRRGDRIAKVDGEPVENWLELAEEVNRAGEGETIVLEVVRRERAIEAELIPGKEMGIRPFVRPVIGEVAPMHPARDAGLLPGDEIVSINGKRVGEWLEVAELIGKTGRGESVEIGVRRAGERLRFTVKPRPDPLEERPIIGIAPQYPGTIAKRFSLPAAAALSLAKIAGLTEAIVRTVANVVAGKVRFRDALGGPVMIARIGYEKARQGIWDLIDFAAVLNVHLMVINLLPFPMLDGGMIILSAFEGIRRRRLSMQVYQTMAVMGWALIISIFLLATYYDLTR